VGRRLSTWILKFSNFWLLINLRRRICFAVWSFIKIGQTIVWIFHAFGFFCCFGVKNRTKWKLLHCNPSINALTWNWRCGGYCAPRFQILSKSDKQFLRFSIYIFFKRQPKPSWIFINLTFWTTIKLWITNMCHHQATFHYNWWNFC